MLAVAEYKLQKRQLDADNLIDTAIASAGLSDFGEFEFRPALRKLLDHFAMELPLSEQGVALLRSDIVRLLVNRLRMQRDLRLHPQILEEDVSDPIIIIGLPRSGTTKLHKMLSAPSTVQKTLFWKMMNAAPFPQAPDTAIDPRIEAVASSGLLSDDKPELDAAHRIAIQEVEEEGLVYQMSFKEFAWAILLGSPEYFDWIMAESSSENYQLARTVFRYLQWQDGGKQSRPWVFKSVPHLAHVDTLLETFPNATLVQPHRDPARCIPSFAKFCHSFQSIYARSVDKHKIGRETLRTWGVAMDRYLAVRERLDLDSRVIDVDYEDVRNDPMSIMHRAYDASNYVMSAEAENAMLAWHQDNEQGAHGQHLYSLEEFGLSEQDIATTFGAYINQFIRK